MVIGLGTRTKFFLTVVAGGMTAFICGTMLAWSSPILEKLNSEGDDNPFDEPISSGVSSWIGSVLNLGAAIGPFIFGYLQDKIGRKYTLMMVAMPFLVSFIIGAFATNVIWFYILRAFAGLGIGGSFTVLPTYLAEISDPPVRGLAGASMNTFICLGLLLSYCIGPYISILWFNIILAIFPAAFIVMFYMFFPDSPYYLVGKDKRQEAEKALCFLRSKPVAEVQAELKEMENLIKEERENTANFLDIFKSKGTTKGFIISVSLVIFQQLCGINVVLFYAQTIFEAASSSNSTSDADINDESALPAAIPPIIVGAVQVVASFITPLLADRLGRKTLLLISSCGIVISEVPLGLYFYLKDEGNNVDAINFLPILTLIVFIFTYCLGIGPLPWTVMAEVFPNNIKSAASSFTAAICWFFAFLLTYFFDKISDQIGMGGSFWIFAGFTVVAFFFTLFYVPETKGKSFKEIQEILNS